MTSKPVYAKDAYLGFKNGDYCQDTFDMVAMDLAKPGSSDYTVNQHCQETVVYHPLTGKMIKNLTMEPPLHSKTSLMGLGVTMGARVSQETMVTHVTLGIPLTTIQLLQDENSPVGALMHDTVETSVTSGDVGIAGLYGLYLILHSVLQDKGVIAEDGGDNGD